MVQDASAGNNNSFDLDAIKAQADRMEQGAALVANERDPADLANEAEAEELTDDILNNPSTNRADEAQAFLNRPAAAKLSSGAVSAIQSAVQLQSEKSTNGFDRRNADDVWNDRKERDEKDRKDQAKIADMADDANNGSQLSTKPDRYGLSEQNYSDLNTELKTRDGQERMMAFLRMMYPNMTDAQIKDRVEKMEAISARESNRPLTKRQQTLLENTPPAEEAAIQKNMKGYQEWRGHETNPSYRVNAKVTPNPTAHNGTVAVDADAAMVRASIRSAVDPAPVSASPDASIAARAPDATLAFNAVAPNAPASPAPQPSRAADLQLAAARAPSSDQSMGI